MTPAMNPRRLVLGMAGALLLVAPGLLGCDSGKGSGSTSSASARAKGKAAGSSTPKAVGSSMSKADLEARLKKAGWTVDESQEMDVDYKRLQVRLSKQEGDKGVDADVNVLYLAEPYDAKLPKAVVQAGKKAALRVAWIPSEEGKKGPDLAAIKKDILAKAPPEKVKDDVFFKDFDKLAESWKLTNDGSRGGGSSWGPVFQNYRWLNGDGGTVSIHVVELGEGASAVVGDTVVWVESEDQALAKKVLAQATGS